MKPIKDLLPQLVRDELLYLVEHPDISPKNTRHFLRVFYSDETIGQFFDNKKFNETFETARKEFEVTVKNVCNLLKKVKK